SRFRFHPKSAPSNPCRPRDRPWQKRGASPPSGRSSRQTGPPRPAAGAANRFPARANRASAGLPLAAAVRPAQNLSPDSPLLPSARLRLQSSPRRERRPSARESDGRRCESVSRTPVHPFPAKPRPAGSDPVFRQAGRRARLPRSPLRQSGISIPARAAVRTWPPARHPPPELFSFFFLVDRQPDGKARAAAIGDRAFKFQGSVRFGDALGDDGEAESRALRLGGEKGPQDFFVQLRRYAFAVVLDRYQRSLPFLGDQNADPAVFRRGLKGIHNQVRQNVVERFPSRDHRQLAIA